jgi:hypothetical protein
VLIILLAYAAAGCAMAYWCEPAMHQHRAGAVGRGARPRIAAAAYYTALLMVAATWPGVLVWGLVLYVQTVRRVP